MTVLIDNEYVTLYYHEDKGMIHHVYKLGIGGDYLKEALNTGTDVLAEKGLTKWLSDNRAIEGVTDEEAAWIDTEWLPRTVEAGWKYWALVVPETQLARINMFQFVTSFSERGIKVRVYSDPDEAMAWLEVAEQPTSKF